MALDKTIPLLSAGLHLIEASVRNDLEAARIFITDVWPKVERFKVRNGRVIRRAGTHEALRNVVMNLGDVLSQCHVRMCAVLEGKIGLATDICFSRQFPGVLKDLSSFFASLVVGPIAIRASDGTEDSMKRLHRGLRSTEFRLQKGCMFARLAMWVLLRAGTAIRSVPSHYEEMEYITYLGQPLCKLFEGFVIRTCDTGRMIDPTMQMPKSEHAFQRATGGLNMHTVGCVGQKIACLGEKSKDDSMCLLLSDLDPQELAELLCGGARESRNWKMRFLLQLHNSETEASRKGLSQGAVWRPPTDCECNTEETDLSKHVESVEGVRFIDGLSTCCKAFFANQTTD